MSVPVRAGDLLRACASWLPGELASPGALDRALRAADRLPAQAAGRICLELRLAPAGGAVDFAATAGPGANAVADLPPLVADVTAAFAGADAPPVRHLWFEWDDGDPELGFAGAALAAAPEPAVAVAVAVDALARLDPGRNGAAGNGAVAQVLGAVRGHPSARIGSVASVACRPGRPAAIVVAGLDGRDAVELLTAGGWDGSASEVDAAYALARHGGVGAELSVVVSADGPRDRVGLELLAPPSRPEAWRPVLAALRGQDLVTAAQTAALLRWIGHTRAADAGERWPPALAQAEALMGGRREAVLVRALNHLKLSVGDGRPPELKAYVALEPRWA